MGFKQKTAPYDKDNMNIAVYRKDLGDGSAAKSNHTGIILQTGISPIEEEAAIAHEKVHQYQQRSGDLDYDKENFYWKGKTYPRENLNEHNEKLPWEVDAYKVSNKLLKGEQKNNTMAKKFTLRNGEGNGASFNDLTSKGLMGASLDTDPLKAFENSGKTPGELPFEGSKKAESNISELKANVPGKGEIQKTKLTKGDPGYDLQGDSDLSEVTKYTKIYKASTPEAKAEGNRTWANRSEEEKNEIRSRKSTFVTTPTKMTPRKATLTTQSQPKLRTTNTGGGNKPNKELEPVYRDKKEIKKAITKQYGGISRDRLSITKQGKKQRGKGIDTRRRKPGAGAGKLLTKVFGEKQTFENSDVEKKVKAAYDLQNTRRKAKKYADKKGVTFLDSGESVADLRKKGKINKSNQSITKKITKGIFAGNRLKKNNQS